MIGHQAVSNHHDAIFQLITFDQAQQEFVVTRIEEKQFFSRAPVVNVIVMVFGEYFAAIRHLPNLFGVRSRTGNKYLLVVNYKPPAGC